MKTRIFILVNLAVHAIALIKLQQGPEEGAHPPSLSDAQTIGSDPIDALIPMPSIPSSVFDDTLQNPAGPAEPAMPPSFNDPLQNPAGPAEAAMPPAFNDPLLNADIQGIESACSEDELGILLPVEDLEHKVFGKLNSTVTITPRPTPPECKYARHVRQFYSLEGCYSAMGFAFGLAKCWATSEMALQTKCNNAHCKDPVGGGASNFLCQKCMAQVRHDRHECAYTYMGISKQCQQCRQDAYLYYDQTCMMQCADTLTLHPAAKKLPAAATTGCRQCNDVFEQRILECGLPQSSFQ